MLEWLNESLQNGGFSLAPRVLLLGGWVATYQAWLSNQALTLSKPLEGRKPLGKVTGHQTASFGLNLSHGMDTSNADHLLRFIHGWKPQDV